MGARRRGGGARAEAKAGELGGGGSLVQPVEPVDLGGDEPHAGGVAGDVAAVADHAGDGADGGHRPGGRRHRRAVVGVAGVLDDAGGAAEVHGAGIEAGHARGQDHGAEEVEHEPVEAVGPLGRRRRQAEGRHALRQPQRQAVAGAVVLVRLVEDGEAEALHEVGRLVAEGVDDDDHDVVRRRRGHARAHGGAGFRRCVVVDAHAHVGEDLGKLLDPLLGDGVSGHDDERRHPAPRDDAGAHARLAQAGVHLQVGRAGHDNGRCTGAAYRSRHRHPVERPVAQEGHGRLLVLVQRRRRNAALGGEPARRGQRRVGAGAGGDAVDEGPAGRRARAQERGHLGAGDVEYLGRAPLDGVGVAREPRHAGRPAGVHGLGDRERAQQRPHELLIAEAGAQGVHRDCDAPAASGGSKARWGRRHCYIHRHECVQTTSGCKKRHALAACALQVSGRRWHLFQPSSKRALRTLARLRAHMVVGI